MLTPQIRIDASCVFCLKPGTGRMSESLSWGLGWGLERTENGNAFWHWGENRGEFHTFAMAYPKQKIGVVIFTNSGNGLSIIPAIVSQIIGGSHPAFAWMGYDLYNSPAKIQFRVENRPVRLLLEAILLQGNSALEQYRKDHKTRSRIRLNENQVNRLGYWLLGKRKFKEAISVFKMNVEDFPNSANVYDSLGEAYMVAGDKAQALKNYQKSLELDPKNTNAAEMIKKLKN